MGVNRINITGTLTSAERPRDCGWLSCKAILVADGGFTFPCYATGPAAKQLLEYHRGDYIVITGHLSKSPERELQVVAQECREWMPAEQKSPTKLGNHPRFVGS
jgi:hypothetical protein